MDDVVTPAPLDVDAEIDRLAARYRAAGGAVVNMLNGLGKAAEAQLDAVPDAYAARVQEVTARALQTAALAASSSRRMVPDQTGWVNQGIGAAMGAAGGVGGLPSAIAELPVTITWLLRVIGGEAAALGFDPAEENVRIDCIQVFASAGPLGHDDGSDLAFVSTKLAASRAIPQIVAAVAPRLSVVLGQKLAAQSVPVLGAMAGAAVNYAYTRYYAEMAHIHFALRRLAIDADIAPEEALARLKRALPAG
ncbi:MAG: EcsC family protein [Pseudomonadota bacterium]